MFRIPRAGRTTAAQMDFLSKAAASLKKRVAAKSSSVDLPARRSAAVKPSENALAPRSVLPLPGLPLEGLADEPELPERITDAALDATKPARSSNSVLPAEMPLAGYLLDRVADGRKLEGLDLERLRLANDSMRETRALLEHGRGNVREDLRHTSDESSRRVSGLHDLEDDAKIQSSYLSRAIWAGAGNCGEHADVSVAAHATRMPPGEEVRSMHPRILVGHRPVIDHGWAEAVPVEDVSAKRPDPERKIVMDAWMDGPAVFERDSPYSALRSQPFLVTIADRFTGAYANALEEAKEQAQEIALKRDVEKLAPDRPPERYVHDARSGVSETFHSRAQEKMDRAVSPKQAVKKGHRSAMTAARDAMATLNPFSSKAANRRAAQSKMRREPGPHAVTKPAVPAGSSTLQELFDVEDGKRVPVRNAPSKTEIVEAESRAHDASEPPVQRGGYTGEAAKRLPGDPAELVAGVPAKLRAQIQAVRVARELAPDISIAMAVKQAPAIVKAAKDLRNTTARGHAAPVEEPAASQSPLKDGA